MSATEDEPSQWSTEYREQYAVFMPVAVSPSPPPSLSPPSPVVLVDQAVSPSPPPEPEPTRRSIGVQTTDQQQQQSPVVLTRRVRPSPQRRWGVYAQHSHHATQLSAPPVEVVVERRCRPCRSSLPITLPPQQTQLTVAALTMPNITAQPSKDRTMRVVHHPKQQQSQPSVAPQTRLVDFRDVLARREADARLLNPRLLHTAPPQAFSSIRPAGVPSTPTHR